jgi:enoyl-CoA hydratase/carnithine racemase
MGDVRLDLPAPGVARLTLDGGEPLNIFDLRMRDALIAGVAAVADLPDVRAVVLAAAGRHFSAGADLREFGTAGGVLAGRRIRWERDPWTPLWELERPVVAALHGVAMGAGLEMALLCDLRLAARDVVLALPEPRLGMLPSAGGTQSATRQLGVAGALRLCLVADRLDADAALDGGLVHALHDDVDAAALALAARIATRPPKALAAAKRLSRLALDVPLAEGLAAERRLARVLAGRW